jgi:arginine repressor
MVGLRTLHYAGRRPSRLDIIKDLIKQHIKDLPVSKLSELQNDLQTKHSLTVEHSWLSRYLKKTLLFL